MKEKNSELVIHITSIGAISFLFDFIHFSPLQFTAREFENIHCREFEDFPMQTVNIILNLANQ